MQTGKSGRVGKVGFVSHKGYGFVDLHDGTRVFAHAGVLNGMKSGQEVEVEIEEGHLGPKVSGIWKKVENPVDKEGTKLYSRED
jgi:cold shock CspA family protein